MINLLMVDNDESTIKEVKQYFSSNSGINLKHICNDGKEACDELTAELDKTEIPINIQNAIDPDWDDNEDEQMSQRVDSIKRAIIDEFFDGVDPVGDDDAE